MPQTTLQFKHGLSTLASYVISYVIVNHTRNYRLKGLNFWVHTSTSGSMFKLISSMPFKRDLTLQNTPLSKQPFKTQPQIEIEDVT